MAPLSDLESLAPIIFHLKQICSSYHQSQQKLASNYSDNNNYIKSKYRQFKSPTVGKVNLQTEHVCQVCAQTFPDKRWLGRHISTFHIKSLPYMCTKCQCGFANESNLTRHNINVHKSKLPVTEHYCNICKRYFMRRGSLVVHMRRHGDNAHSCTVCRRAFETSEKLEQHAIAHRPCQICGVITVGGLKGRENHIKEHQSRQIDIETMNRSVSLKSGLERNL